MKWAYLCGVCHNRDFSLLGCLVILSQLYLLNVAEDLADDLKWSKICIPPMSMIENCQKFAERDNFVYDSRVTLYYLPLEPPLPRSTSWGCAAAARRGDRRTPSSSHRHSPPWWALSSSCRSRPFHGDPYRNVIFFKLDTVKGQSAINFMKCKDYINII